MFEFRPDTDSRRGRDWGAALAIQAVLVMLFVAALGHVVVLDPRRPAGSEDTALVYLVGPDESPAPPPQRAGSRTPPAGEPAAVVVDAPVDSAPPGPPAVIASVGGPGPGPAVGDGSLWVTPRPALPATVADQLYGQPRRDSIAIARLQAMVDTLNRVLDEQQRAHRLPDWTIGGDDGPKWGIDQQWIHLGDIKIPTPVLALLGGLLPQTYNYDEGLRNQQLARMREDLLYSAWRAQTFQDFKRYVRETRERRQRERDEERERGARDTTQVQP